MARGFRTLRMERLEERQMMAVTALANLQLVSNGGIILDPKTPPAGIPIEQGLNLSSRPNAPATLYLDFNGHFQGEQFGDFYGIAGWEDITTPAFNRAGERDPNVFSPNEQKQIEFIWASVAEDYSPFNINVTTIDPEGPNNPHPGRPFHRVVFSSDPDFRGEGAGGITPQGALGEWDAYADDGIPNISYVFNGATETIRFLAEAASHEAGHAFGLDHYSDDPSNTDHAPIMAKHSAAHAGRGTWWARRGSYYNGDLIYDIAVIAGSANGFGFRTDDFNNSFAGASELRPDSRPGLHAKGVIEIPTEIDTFKFTTGGGNVSVHLELPWRDLQGPRNIGNLNPTLQLFDSSGNLLDETSGPVTNAVEGLNLDSITLPAGTFFVRVGSVGEYGSVGQYFLTVTEDLGAKIVSSSFQSISATQIGMLVTFNESINALTFTTADVKINGSAAGAGVVSVVPTSSNSRTFLITMNKPSGSFNQISIGPNISDLFGNRMDQNQNRVLADAADSYFATYYGSANLGATTPLKAKIMNPLLAW